MCIRDRFYSDEDLKRTETYQIGPHYEPYLSIALLSIINPALGQSPTAPLFLSQASGRPYGSVFAGLGALDPVSYTHLDVYKRQELDSVPDRPGQ